ncbi:MAG: DUF1501 domain-containing protein [Opitutales bacterium]|jgi:hypothetical protein|nr:DUF1501 domain-containing protein [Opitutales bacterium]MDP4644442.1 DUF1501 domain-containing protein [Opitutales bacterium]MDP4777304.1 DUF1501 domain-containing protein [Opitutales bacterium]MDP4883527.1 DUF1501 domain-containing protein [Opitutales bacterium]MDP5079988.1 DUF1501 domain-containing protein [Opitutales bacterium]
MFKELNHLDELSRRKFIQYSAKAMLGVGLASTSNNLWGSQIIGKPTAKSVIYIYLSGGMSHIDTFDPKPGWEQQGPVQTINTNVAGIRVSEYLPSLAKRMDKMAIIRSMTSTQGAHEQGTYFMHTSYEQRGTIKHPGLGAWLNTMSGKTNSTLPGNIRIGGSNNAPGGAGFFDSKYEPLHLGDPNNGLPYIKRHQSISEIEMQERLAIAQMMDLSFHQKYPSKKVQAYSDVYDEATRLMRSEDLQAFDLNKEPQSVRARYGDTKFGKGCLLARRLVEHGVRFVEVTHGGWDTHNDNHELVSNLSNPLDQSVSALLDDLHLRGLLEETLVVIGTEFGRSPKINVNSGRDHHPKVFSCVLAGGGIKGGQVYGASDESGHSVAESPVTVPDFNATIAYSLGLPTDKVVYSPSGRPFQVAHKGQALTGLF